MGKSKSSEGNRWLKDRNGFEEELLALADDASIMYESALDLLKGLQYFSKNVGEDEKKHPYGKAAKAAKTYGGGMKVPSASFTSGAEQLTKLHGACEGLKEHIGSTVLAKMISFKDIECKECDMQMTMLKKAHNDYYKKKKANAEQVALDAAEASLKKLLEDAKSQLNKFNKAGQDLMNQMSTDMKTGFDAYCDAGSA
ncbi:unnamed protein product [Caenorhabditis sp. 36 PRJEB53466]|nr:unnamed protein product [Caenorhabditis sp. 36 PRJEB53466]